jgi:hypothetical protein
MVQAAHNHVRDRAEQRDIFKEPHDLLYLALLKLSKKVPVVSLANLDEFAVFKAQAGGSTSEDLLRMCMIDLQSQLSESFAFTEVKNRLHDLEVMLKHQ